MQRWSKTIHWTTRSLRITVPRCWHVPHPPSLASESNGNWHAAVYSPPCAVRTPAEPPHAATDVSCPSQNYDLNFLNFCRDPKIIRSTTQLLGEDVASRPFLFSAAPARRQCLARSLLRAGNSRIPPERGHVVCACFFVAVSLELLFLRQARAHWPQGAHDAPNLRALDNLRSTMCLSAPPDQCGSQYCFGRVEIESH